MQDQCAQALRLRVKNKNSEQQTLPPPGDILDGKYVHPSAPKQVRQKRGSSSVCILMTSPNILHITSKVSTWSKAS